MGIKVGADDVVAIMVGSTEVVAVYVGAEQVYSAEGQPVGFSFNMTAGSFVGAAFGYISGLMGTIDAEPVPGAILASCYYDPGGAFDGSGRAQVTVGISGGVLSDLQPCNLWLSGVNYGGAGSWTDDGGGPQMTLFEDTTTIPHIADGVTYLVELK